MDAIPTSERIRRLIGQFAEVDPAEVVPAGRLRGYSVDSLRAFDLVMSLEDEFGIQIQIEDLQTVRTVGDLVGFVEARLEQRENYEGHDATAS
jgi:acyl carrier protein